MSKTYTLSVIGIKNYTGNTRNLLADGASNSLITSGTSNYIGHGSTYRAVRFEFDHDTIDHLRTLTSSQITSITLKVNVTTSYTSTLQTYVGACKTDTTTHSWVESTVSINIPSGIKEQSLDITSVGIPQNSHCYAIGGCRSSQSGDYYKIVSNTVTLVVVTTETDYTLSYNANGGSGAPSSQSAAGVGSAKFTISSTSPTRSGYVFKGWATSSTATSASYQPGGTITISANTTLYAVWYVTITLTYNANGGSGAPSTQSQTVYSSATFTVSATQPTKTDFVFVGWADSSTATTASYQAGDSITTSANKTIYAVWATSGCPIHYYNGSAIKDCELYYYNGTTLKTCELYYFDGTTLIKCSS